MRRDRWDRWAGEALERPSRVGWGLGLGLGLPLLVLLGLVAREAGRHVVGEARAQGAVNARLVAKVVEERMQALTAHVEVVAAGRRLRMLAGSGRLREAADVLRDLAAAHPLVDRAFLTDARGVERADFPHDPQAIGRDFSDRDWYRGVTAARGTYVSEIYTRFAAPRARVVAVATPVTDPGGRIGAYLVVQHNLEQLVAWAGTLAPLPGGAIVLEDHRGHATEGTAAGVLESSAPVGRSGYTVRVRMPWQTVLQPVNALRAALAGSVLVVFGAVGCAGVLWWRAVRRANEQLAALNRELEAFSFSVSHDLRAPLRTIGGFSQALEEDCADRLGEEGRRHLAWIQSGVRRMGELIDALLELSRLTRLTPVIEPVDVTALAREAAEECERSAPGRRVSWRVEDGMRVQGDSRLIRTALRNLLDNAWKFTAHREAAHIEVGTARAANGERVFEVRDNGAGFDMAQAGKLFGPFQRLHTVEEFPGTGVGLAVVQRILAKHGGRIWAEGRTGEGAVFRFTLPS